MAKITLKGNLVHTNGELPKVGKVAPPFLLVDGSLNNQTLDSYMGKKKLLSIVPSLDTEVCSTMAKKFNDALKDHPDTVLLLISADLPFAQKRFCEKEKAKNIVALSMMRSKDFAFDYGVLIQDGPLAGICARAVVVLDKENRVVYTELVDEITKEPHYDKALSYLK